MIKTISLTLEDTELNLEREDHANLIDFQIGKIEEDGCVTDVIHVLPSIKEVKEIIKALQNILPDEESVGGMIGGFKKESEK